MKFTKQIQKEKENEILQQVSTEQYQNRQLTVRHSHRGHRRPGTRRSSNPSLQARCNPKTKKKNYTQIFISKLRGKYLPEGQINVYFSLSGRNMKQI